LLFINSPIFPKITFPPRISFPIITPEQKKEIAGSGGKAVHIPGKVYKFDSETALHPAFWSLIDQYIVTASNNLVKLSKTSGHSYYRT
jgi:hypothetical protein